MKNLKFTAVFILLVFCLTGCSNRVENEEMTLSFFDKDLKGKFSGTLKDKKPEGKGTFVFKKNKQYLTYKGNFSKGRPEDKGSVKTNLAKVKLSATDTTGVYDGETLNGKFHGSGKYKVQSPANLKSTYTGLWKNNLPEGTGELVFDDKDYPKQAGTFTKGYFTPNVLEFFNTLGSLSSMPFSISYKAQEFLSDQEELFPAKSLKQIKKYTDPSIKYEQVFRHPDQYGDKIVRLSNYYIVQMDSYSAFGYDYNEVLLLDRSGKHVCIVYYLDELENIYESDFADVYGIPVNTSSYENKNGKKIKTCILAGSYFKKVK